MVSLQDVYTYVSRMENTKAAYIHQREFGTVFPINTKKRGEVWLQWPYDFSFKKIVIKCHESVSESESHNSSLSDNETLPDSPIKQKRKQRRIQLLCAEELSEEQPPESIKRKLDTVENGRNNEADDTEKSSEKTEEKKEEEEQDIHLQIDCKRKATIFYPLKVVKEVIVIEIDDE